MSVSSATAVSLPLLRELFAPGSFLHFDLVVVSETPLRAGPFTARRPIIRDHSGAALRGPTPKPRRDQSRRVTRVTANGCLKKSRRAKKLAPG
eukprot:9486752-Pyramimonas_sp.AAC.2